MPGNHFQSPCIIMNGKHGELNAKALRLLFFMWWVVTILPPLLALRKTICCNINNIDNVLYCFYFRFRGGQVNKVIEVQGLELYCRTVEGTLDLLSVENTVDSKIFEESNSEAENCFHVLSPLDVLVSLSVCDLQHTFCWLFSPLDKSCYLQSAIGFFFSEFCTD